MGDVVPLPVRRELPQDTERDKVLIAEQAVEYGVVDAVITERDAVWSGREAERSAQ